MKFNVLYCDPPWCYSNKNTGGKHRSGAANKYAVLTIEELLNLKISNITDDNCVLFLWATTPLLPEAVRLIEHWGFKYKTAITWEKTGRLGMGYWLRVQSEHLLIAIKGKVKPFRSSKRNVIRQKPLRHSEKPEEFRKLIEECTVNVENRKLLELFARKEVEGWECWGAEIDGQDVRDLIDNYK
jgi:N6-adenosine-specific RNA methylase IME4